MFYGGYLEMKKKNLIMILLFFCFFMLDSVHAEETEENAKLAVPLKSIIDTVSPYQNGRCPSGFSFGGYDNKECFSII